MYLYVNHPYSMVVDRYIPTDILTNGQQLLLYICMVEFIDMFYWHPDKLTKIITVCLNGSYTLFRHIDKTNYHIFVWWGYNIFPLTSWQADK